MKDDLNVKKAQILKTVQLFWNKPLQRVEKLASLFLCFFLNIFKNESESNILDIHEILLGLLTVFF